MSYRKMTGLACFVASQHVAEYDRDTVEIMVEEFGWEAADDFYEMIGWRFGADVKKIRRWIDEMAQEDE
tara:strand:- start:180 stop:386 length:207 start_codon:yes stop_codon:yes gene_type:complete